MKKLYLLIPFTLLVALVFAQSPGGVGTTLTMWVKANSGITAPGGLISTWTYANDGTKFFQASGAAQPTFTNSVINFQPAAVFTGTQFMDGPTSLTAAPNTGAPITVGNDAYAAFVVWKSTSATTFQRIWEQRAACGFCNNAFAISTNNNGSGTTGNYGDESATNPFTYALIRPFTTSTWNISQLNLTATATNDLEIVDDRSLNTSSLFVNTDPGATPDGAALRNISGDVNRIGDNYDNASPLTGAIAEIIVYDRSIVAGPERNKIFSYLSMKYGIPLNTNLVSSGGTTIWDATANSAYNTAVFGLGFDAASSLSVTSSNSITSGNGDGTGISGAGNVVLSSPSLSTDGSFLFAGHNGASLTETTTGAPAFPPGLSIMGRRWKAMHTGNVGTVTVAVDYNGLSPVAGPGGTTQNFRLIVDATGNNDFTTTAPTVYTPATVAGNIVTYNGVTLPNNAVFTFGSSATILPVTWTSFTANLQNNNVYLNWSVENNQQAKSYEVQHSTDGVNFSKIGEVANDPAVKAYNMVYTPLTAGKHYFRVLEVDLDGQAIYSKIASVTTQAAAFSFRLINNPVFNNSAEFEVNAVQPSNVSIELWSVAGVKIATRQQTINSGINRLSIPMGNVAAGNYVLTVKIGDTILHEKVAKQ